MESLKAQEVLEVLQGFFGKVFKCSKKGLINIGRTNYI
jgi:hypothetical protein